MKTISRIFLMTLTLLFVSCNKNEELMTSKIEESTSIESLEILENVPFIHNPYHTDKYLEVYEDLDDKRIKRSLYDLSMVAREILKSNEWNETIISRAKENLSSTMNMNDLSAQTNLKSEAVLFESLRAMLQDIDLTHFSINSKKSGEVENYVPAFYVPNIDIADFNKQIIVSPGVEVNSELSGTEYLEDYIVAWTYIDGVWEEFLLNEETAMNTSHPIIIIDNASEELMNTSPRKYPDFSEAQKKKSINTSVQMKVSTKEYRLDYRFEDSGNSEFWIYCLHVDGEGIYHGPIDDLTISLEQKIAEVDKEDIGKDLQQWFDIARGVYDPVENHALLWNTFERDWYRSPKWLGTPTWAGGTFYLYGNMHYESDWYGCKPERINEYIVRLGDLYSNWLFDTVSDHGRLGIWRTAY